VTAARRSRWDAHLNRSDSGLGRLRDWLILEVQFQRFSQVGQGIIDGFALAGYLNLKAASDVPVALSADNGMQRSDVFAHGLSIRVPLQN
jgi:hypothetical protein